jgi:hypothetical protein
MEYYLPLKKSLRVMQTELRYHMEEKQVYSWKAGRTLPSAITYHKNMHDMKTFCAFYTFW